MLYFPTRSLKAGMILASDIDYGASNFPLLTKDQVLTDRMINKIFEKGIQGVYIESKIAKDIVIKDIVEKKVQSKAIASIKNIFEEFSHKNEINIENLRSISDISKVLVDNILDNKEILINLSSLKDYDNYTYNHSLSVAILSVTIGAKLGYNEAALISLASSGLLHDIGKVQIPLEIVKKPGDLSDEEFAIIQKHPKIAYEQLDKSGFFPMSVLKGIESHHEKFDGTGYPYGLEGEAIPLYGRILAVADVYDAITSDRPYRQAWFANDAIEYMMTGAQSHFDYEILLAFLKCVAAYPVGMLVSLSDGRKAMVVKNHSENTLRPIIRPILMDGSYLEDLDLLNDAKNNNITIIGRCDEYGDIS